MKKCNKTEEIYGRQVDGAITEEDRQHIESCEACREFFADNKKIDEVLAMGKYPVPEGLEESLSKIPKQSKERDES